jgi:leucyl aminopeptidase
MPSGKAIRPGDIVKASNGTTIEILNTDAEGRLTLADALTYAKKLEPTAMVDLATLTGACMVGLGEEITAAMGNNDDLVANILESADDAGEKMWKLPLEKRYRSLIESEVADLRNIATTRYGGSITAGLFLQEFVGDLPWAHLDIAGPAFAERPLASYLGKGGTGHGVRTLVELIDRM